MTRISSLTAFLLLFTAGYGWGKSPIHPLSSAGKESFRHGSRQLTFVENKGQVTDQNYQPRTDIQYRVTAADGLSIFIGNGAIHYQFARCENSQAVKEELPGQMPGREPVKAIYTTYRMDVTLVGANTHAAVVTDQQQGYYEMYYTPGTGANGMTVHSFNKITYKNIYPHIDWVLYSNSGKLKHEFVVHEGGNVSDIRLKYGGAAGLKTDNAGNLIANTELGTITEDAPYCYQQGGAAIASHFSLAGDVVSYDLAAHSGEVIIDPSIAWVVYLGPTATDASSEDNFNGVATDATGDVYVCGRTTSATGMATTGAYASTFAGASDAMLIKYNSEGTILWSTYYGGTSWDAANGITIDASGDVFVAGDTRSASGISTPGAHQEICTDVVNGDGFLVKFSNAGARLWGTYYGGTNPDFGQAVATDASGNVYMAGLTGSSSGIASAGAHQTVKAGTYGYDAFLCKFSGTGTFNWGTYYGGIGDDQAEGVAVDNAGNPYIAGRANSTTAIATTGAHQEVNGGNADAFLAKFDPAGVRQWGTYYGGAGAEECHAVAADASGNIYVTGMTVSTTDIATPGAYQPSKSGGGDNFIVKFNSLGVRQWGTYYGGDGLDVGYGITLDTYGNIYLAGRTTSTTGIATPDAYQAAYAGGWVVYDAFIAKFSTAGMLEWGSYYGFYNYYEYGRAIATDAFGHVYMAGTKGNTGYPYEAPAYGDDNSYLMRLNQTGSFTGPAAICAGTTATYTHDTAGGTWNSSNIAVATVVSTTGELTGIAPGTTMLSYTIASGTITRIITIDSVLTAQPITGMSTVCAGGSVWLDCANTGGTWSSSNISVATVGASSGNVGGVTTGTAIISYTVSNSCGTVTVTTAITVNPPTSAGTIMGMPETCVGSSTTLISSVPGGTWSCPVFWIASVDAAGVVTGIDIGTATISYSVSGTCGTGVAIMVVTVNAGSSSPLISGTLSLCETAITFLSASVPGGSWSGGAAGIASISSSGIVSGIGAGTATISYTVLSSCGTTTDMAVVTVNAAPASVITGSHMLCVSSTTTLSASAPGGSWSSSNTTIATVSSSGVVSGMAAGTALISYVLANSCGIAVATYSVTVQSLPATPGITGASAICIPATATLVASAPGGSWTSSNTTVAPVSSTGVVSAASTGTAVISYTLSNSCGSVAATHAVTVGVLPPVSITGGPAVCVWSTTLFTTSTPGGTWSSSNTTIAAVSITGLVTGVTHGTAIISYTRTSTCGSATATLPITVDSAAVAGMLSGPSVMCVGATATFTTTGSAGGTWSIGSPWVATAAASGMVTGTAAGTTAVSYTVTNSCGSSDAATMLTVTTPPATPTLTGAENVCVGSTISLAGSATGGSWSSGSTATATVGATGIVTGASVGTAAISYTLTNMCGTATAVKTVSVTTVPAAASITGVGSVCVGATITLGASVAGGVWTSSSPASVSSAGVVTGVFAATALVTYTVSNSCGSTSTVATVTVLPASACTTGLTEAAQNTTFNVYPNPSGGRFTISLPATGEAGYITVTNVLGQVVATLETGRNETTIPMQLTNAPTGSYIVTARLGNEVYRQKITIVK